MLNILRVSVNNIIVKVLLIVFIVAFLSIGSASLLFTKQDYVLEIGKMQYTREALEAAIEKQMPFLLYQTKDDDVDTEKLRAQAVQNIISENMLLQESDRLKLYISDDVVRYYISNELSLQKDGKFNKELFADLLKRQNISEAVFIRGVKDQIAQQQLIGLFSSGKVITDGMVNQIFDSIYSTRDVTVFKLDKSVIQITEEPNDEELLKLFEAEKQNFATPEARTTSYFELLINDVKTDFIPSEQDISAQYTASAVLLREPEKRKLSQLLFETENDANVAYKKLLDGKSFDEIRNYIKMTKDQSELGFVTHDELLSEASDIVFQLKVSEFSKPVMTPLGWHIFAISEILPAKQKTLDEARDDIIKQLKSEKKMEKFRELAATIEEELLSSNRSIEGIARQNNLKLNKATLVKEDISFPEAFISDVFSIIDEKDRGIFHEDPKSFIFYELDEIKKSEVKDFQTVKAELKSTWLKHAQYKMAKGISLKLKDANPDDKMQNVSSYNEKFSLLKKSDNLQSDWTSTILSLKVGEMSLPIEGDNHSYVLIKLLSRQPFVGEEAQNIKNKIKKDIIDSQKEMLFEQYYSYLKKQYIKDRYSISHLR